MTIQAENLIQIDNQIWQKFGFRSGSDVERNKEKYIAEVAKALKGERVGKNTIDELENENYHSMVEAITILNRTR